MVVAAAGAILNNHRQFPLNPLPRWLLLLFSSFLFYIPTSKSEGEYFSTIEKKRNLIMSKRLFSIFFRVYLFILKWCFYQKCTWWNLIKFLFFFQIFLIDENRLNSSSFQATNEQRLKVSEWWGCCLLVNGFALARPTITTTRAKQLGGSPLLLQLCGKNGTDES